MKIRSDGRTPGGGDYSELVFFDDGFHETDEEHATRCIIRECRADGTLIRETYGVCGGQAEDRE